MEFDHLYTEYRERIYKRALSLTGHKQRAEDLTQDAFLKAWRAWPPQENGNLYAWLYSIVTRLAYDQYRHNAHVQFQELTDGVVQHHTAYEPLSGLVEQWAQVEAINSLDGKKRDILLCKATGDSVEAIAAKYGYTVTTTYTYYKRIHKEVQARYQELSA